MPPQTATAIRQLLPGTKSEGMKDLDCKAHIGHSMGLISSLGKYELLSMIEICDVVDSERIEPWGGAQAAGEAGESLDTGSRRKSWTPELPGEAGVPYVLVTSFAGRKKLRCRDQQPPHQLPDSRTARRVTSMSRRPTQEGHGVRRSAHLERLNE